MTVSLSALHAVHRFIPKKHYVFEEWCLLGCYAVWLL
jgi:hypothetical protein